MALNHELRHLRLEIIGFATTCQENFQQAVTAFHTRDKELAHRVEAGFLSLDSFEQEVMQALALYQPVASDLKEVIEYLKVGQELDMLQTYIQRFAKKVRKYVVGEELSIPEPVFLQLNIVVEGLDEMCKLVQNPEAAYDLARFQQLDEECHSLKKQIAQIFEERLRDRCDHVPQLMLIQGVSRNLNRVSRIVLNIVEELSAAKS